MLHFLTCHVCLSTVDGWSPLSHVTIIHAARVSKLLHGIGVITLHEPSSGIMDTPAFMAFVSKMEFPEVAAKQVPGLLTADPAAPAPSPITLSRLHDMFAASAAWYTLAPWRWFAPIDVLAVTVSKPVRQDAAAGGADDGAKTYYVVVMGQSGMAYGLGVFEDLATLRAQLCGQRPAAGSTVRSLRFEAMQGAVLWLAGVWIGLWAWGWAAVMKGACFYRDNITDRCVTMFCAFLLQRCSVLMTLTLRSSMASPSHLPRRSLCPWTSRTMIRPRNPARHHRNCRRLRTFVLAWRRSSSTHGRCVRVGPMRGW